MMDNVDGDTLPGTHVDKKNVIEYLTAQIRMGSFSIIMFCLAFFHFFLDDLDGRIGGGWNGTLW